MSEGLQLISGAISNLELHDGEEAFIRSAGQRAAGAGAAVGLAAAGLGGAAVGASIAAASTGDPVQFFSCDIGNQRVAGRFSKASFKAGDELTLVVEQAPGESPQVLAAMRPSDRTLWIVPHCSRGVRMHRAFSIRVFWWLLMGVPIFSMVSYLIFGVWVNGEPLEINGMLQFVSALSLGIGAVTAPYYAIRFYFQWRPIALQAERIFAALGYPDPSRVDLPRDHKRYCKAHGIPWPYLTDGGWIYHYIDPHSTPNA